VAKVSGLTQTQVKTVIKAHQGSSCCFPALNNPKRCDSDPQEDLVELSKQYAAKLKKDSKHDSDDKHHSDSKHDGDSKHDSDKGKTAQPTPKPTPKPSSKATSKAKPAAKSPPKPHDKSVCSRAR